MAIFRRSFTGAYASEKASGDAAIPSGNREAKAEGLGYVLQIQRMSTEDGPGLRTTAFLKGCPLSCAWCHNPESIDPRPEVQWIGLRCIAASTADGCGACLKACPRHALSRSADGSIVVDRQTCSASACGAPCADACPGGAMELLGKRMTAADLARELLKDRDWFKGSKRGGITLSGGEACAQPEFALETLRICREAGVHTALDTCGVAPWSSLARLYSEVDLVLYDLKEADPVRHKAYTGLGNGIIFDNLEKTARLMRESPLPAVLWIRTPIVPGATDREEGLFALGERLAAIAPPRLERWELCAFNNLCADKYSRLGRKWEYAQAPLMTALDMSRLVAAARRGSRGLVEVSWTGSVRIEPERN